VMQADLYKWGQKPGGEDDLVLTEDIILSPPIVKLAPRSRQIVRLARLTAPPSTDQLTYRMIVREVPEARPPSPDLKLQIALAFSLPVFITPPGAKRQFSCGVERAAPDSVNAVCENKGNAYAQAVSFKYLSAGDEQIASRDTGGYLLPDIKRTFTIKSQGPTIPAGRGKLRVTLDDGTVQNFDVTLPD
jgi:fimbrial chaperone protein